MGFFDALVDVSFLKDDDGNEIFFPRGIRKRGYVLADPSKKQEIKKLLQLQYLVGIISPVLLLIVVILAIPEDPLRWLVFGLGMGLVLLGLFLWGRTAAARLAKGLPTTNHVPKKLSWSDRLGRIRVVAKATNVFLLWLGQITSLLMVIVGLYLIGTGLTKISIIAVVLFFGFVSVFYCWMLIAKYRS
jgi:hypothetical protein